MGLRYLIAVLVDLATKRHTYRPIVSVPQGGGDGGPSALAPGLVFFGALLVALIGSLAYAMQRARRQAFSQIAAQLNLSYSRDDPLGLLDHPFTLFGKGDRRTLENVVFGAWQEVE